MNNYYWHSYCLHLTQPVLQYGDTKGTGSKWQARLCPVLYNTQSTASLFIGRGLLRFMTIAYLHFVPRGVWRFLTLRSDINLTTGTEVRQGKEKP